jgi:hypothetical protein
MPTRKQSGYVLLHQRAIQGKDNRERYIGSWWTLAKKGNLLLCCSLSPVLVAAQPLQGESPGVPLESPASQRRKKHAAMILVLSLLKDRKIDDCISKISSHRGAKPLHSQTHLFVYSPTVLKHNSNTILLRIGACCHQVLA